MSRARRPTRQVDAVVVGASAGGVEALSVLLAALPPALRAAVFVVLHLPKDRPSLLVDIFQPRCARPVREAQDKEAVEAGTVYVAPPDYHLLIEEGPRLALSVDDPVHFSRPSIDVLFESAADVFGERLLGIILTGASRDGADGLDAVRRTGGWTVVQTPATAHAMAMPAAAIGRGPVDAVLDVEEIAALLREIE
jgi:two-component system, chemotaxis family, protein-glutamate methylesterase/glutaminase